MKFDVATDEELPFVFDSWARSFQKSPWAGCIPNHVYPTLSRQAAAEIVDRGARILVAYVDLPEGGRRVMGYSVSEPKTGVLHWLFVKRDYRNLGVGRALLDETVKDWSGERWYYTYRTESSAPFLGQRFKHSPRFARMRV